MSREKGEHKKDAQDYFLASRALPWWAIGTSLIAANISAEQIVGMSGSGYVMGMAIASYEWMAALTLIIVGKWILPVFLKNGIYTMPEFLERRYSPGVRTVMAIFWLVLYIFVNLTSILWLGSLAVNTITGLDLQVSITALALFALLYALYGGLKAVALTDIVQVSLLVAGRNHHHLDLARQGRRRRRRDRGLQRAHQPLPREVRHDPVAGQPATTRSCRDSRCCWAACG